MSSDDNERDGRPINKVSIWQARSDCTGNTHTQTRRDTHAHTNTHRETEKVGVWRGGEALNRCRDSPVTTPW